MGHTVNLLELDAFRENVASIRAAGGIDVNGVTQSGENGFAQLDTVSTDPGETVPGADLIVVAAPAIGHESFFDVIVPHLEPGQHVWVPTGYWASVRFADDLRDVSLFDDVVIGEGNIMPYATVDSSESPDETIEITNIKRETRVATFPGSDVDAFHDRLSELYPQYEKSPHLGWTNLAAGNPPIHATMSIPMAGIMYERYREFRFYAECTDMGGRLVDAFDDERMEIAAALDADVVSQLEWSERAYGYTGDEIGQTLRQSDHADMFTTSAFMEMILKEDLAYNYVPMSYLGEILDIPTPVTDAMVTVLSIMLETPYRELAPTRNRLGFQQTTREELLAYLRDGT
jgi:opine dehydrogenase